MAISSGEMVWIWVGFGVAAGIVAMILPFRRGVLGIVTNVALGVLGALLGGVIGRALDARSHFHDPTGLVLSAVVSVLTLGVFHALWLRGNPRLPRA